jgi:hypothetical protein
MLSVRDMGVLGDGEEEEEGGGGAGGVLMLTMTGTVLTVTLGVQCFSIPDSSATTSASP